jgi:hypothetical protein
MNVRELKVELAFPHPGGKNFPSGGQSASEAAEREVRVPACEQSINGSPDKHKGVVRATRALCSRETRCSAAEWGNMTASTGARWGSPTQYSCAASVRITRIRAEIEHECVHGYVCGWTGRAEGFDPSGVCVRICANVGGLATGATRNRRWVHSDETETRARRADLGEAVFRVEVAKRVRTWCRWLDGHTCAGALGFAATARRNVEHGHRQVKQGSAPRLHAFVCVPNADGTAMAATRN